MSSPLLTLWYLALFRHWLLLHVVLAILEQHPAGGRLLPEERH